MRFVLLRLLGSLHVGPEHEIGRKRRAVCALGGGEYANQKEGNQRPAYHDGLLAGLLDVNQWRCAYGVGTASGGAIGGEVETLNSFYSRSRLESSTFIAVRVSKVGLGTSEYLR